MPRRPPRWLPNPTWLVASMVLVVAILVPVAYVAMPGVYRWHRLNQLVAEAPDTRERALNYVIRHAGDDPAVRDAAIGRLDRVERRDHFIALVNALDHAGVWSRRHVGDEHWLRWLGVLGDAPEAPARRLAAERLGELTDLPHHPTLRELLEALLDDERGAVRRDALRTTALLLPHADAPTAFERSIAERTMDDDATVAREAWMLVGLVGPIADRQANWRDAPPEVAEAMIWAAVRTRPEHPQPALEALADPDASDAARAIAAYALHRSDTQAAHEALENVLAHRPIPRDRGGRRVELKRAMLAVSLDESASVSAFDQLCQELLALDAEQRTAVRPLLAACHFHGASTDDGLEKRFDGLRAEPVLALAMLEGLEAGRVGLPVTPADAAMVRLIATAKLEQPEVELIVDLLSHGQAAMRDLACVVAVESFSEDTVDALIHDLLTDLTPDARASGAILAGLSGLRGDLLAEAAAMEDVWRVQTLMQVGLWMQGRRPEMTRRLPGLLTREDLPMSTLLLALIHRGDAVGWDYLLAPHGEPAPDLHRLLTHYRWWHAVARHLPDDAPPLWLWADAGLQRFQIDVLRLWYLLHRHDLTAPPGAD